MKTVNVTENKIAVSAVLNKTEVISTTNGTSTRKTKRQIKNIT